MTLLQSLRDKAVVVFSFSMSDWVTLMESWWLLFVFDVALLLTSFDHLNSASQLVGGETMDEPNALLLAHHNKRLIGYAARLHLFPKTCLVKSLTLKKILSGRKIPAQVQIGVQKTDGSFFAHAWVVVNGVPVDERGDLLQKFYVLESISAVKKYRFI